MLNVLKVYTSVTEGDTRKIRADISVSTVSELPYPTQIEGVKFIVDTMAYVRQTGEFYVLDSNDKWYNSDGTGEAG